MRPDGSVTEAEGYFHGEVGYERIGTNGFGYDPLFYLPEYHCTAAELSPEKKNEISHRAVALQLLVEKLKQENLELKREVSYEPPEGYIEIEV